MTIQHSALGNTEYAHNPYRWIVVDQAARDALTPVEGDVGKLLLQQSNNTTWVLVAHDPVTWQGFATSAQGALAQSAVQPSRTVSAGTGLSGGGNLAANITISLDSNSSAALVLASSALQPGANISSLNNDAGFGTGNISGPVESTNNNLAAFDGTTGKLLKDSGISTAGIVANTRQIFAGAGLTGGGDLSADRTISLDANSTASLALADSAVQPTASDASSFGFVLDEDNMASNSATKLATQQSIKAYVDNRVVGMLDYQGGYDASTNTPDLDTSPAGVLQGHVFTVTVAGTFFSASVEPGDFLIAEQDNPTLESHWTIVQANLTPSMVLALLSGQALSVASINTGHGDVECFAMDQSVRTTDVPTFGNATADGHVLNRVTGDGRYGRLATANSWAALNTFAGGVDISSQFIAPGGHFGTAGTSPASGIYTDIGYSAGGSKGYIQTYNRTSSVFVNLNINNTMELLANGNVHVGGTSDPGVKFGVTGAGLFTTGVTVASGEDVLANNKQTTYTATLTCTTSGTITLASGGNTLRYTRIGNDCRVAGWLTVDSVSSPLGGLRVNLPFTCADLSGLADYSPGKCLISNSATKNSQDFVSLTAGGLSLAVIYRTDASNLPDDAAAEVTASSTVYIDISFPVA